MKVLKSNTNGKYLVNGRGFIAANQNEATCLQDEDVADAQECALAMGLGDTTAEAVANTSFAVVYIRKGDVAADGKVAKQQPKADLNQVDPSKRRFATFGEAVTHGSRFTVRIANKGDAPGSAGHRGFYVIETSDPVNAAVNPESGLTNPV